MAVKETIVRNLLRPLISRVGTAIAMLLVAKGVESPMVEQFVNALVAFGLVAVDLLLSSWYRQKEVNAALSEASKDRITGFGFSSLPLTRNLFEDEGRN